MGAKQSKIVAAIDFGTSYSGFAYMFSADKDEIITAKHGTFLPEDRVPTVLLLNPDETFNSFGIDAEDRYSALVLADKHCSYRLFREFKMALFTKNEKLKSDILIHDTEGRSKKATDVFSIVIGHLKSLVINSIKSKVVDTSFESKIEWMLTIPAVWPDSARQFMRQAPQAGGIEEDKLRLVLEPEAAALFCKDQLLHLSHNAGLTLLKPGTKYILADLGGGTADICVHEVLKNGHIRELYRAVGGPFGGTTVNNAFVQFMIKLFGAPIWRKLQKYKCYDYIRIMREFEKKKKKFDFKNTVNFVVDIPSTLINMVESDVESDLETLLSQTDCSASVQFKDDKLICDKKIMASFFESSINDIVSILREIFANCPRDELKTLLVVGGYSESQYLRESITKAMRHVEVVLAQEPRLAVLKGAVKMGLEPKNIIERKVRYTYGFCTAETFKEGEHPSFLKFEREGKTLCDRIFSKVIEKNAVVTSGQEFKVTTFETVKESRWMNLLISLYRSTKFNPKYCLKSEECTMVGKIKVNAPSHGWPTRYSIDLIIIAQETEFKVRVIDWTSSRKFETNIDFL
ncbi:heat shock 70 kDa protein 12A-like [Mercenaria mercenaria]|uniref:heat shock 70 kDa protein 12A-like n=1 Tax=Mercenaria mercenaria TaxID=6596 RepID=UPI00234EC7DA|nr:heat shock 70 kDa protein 12A-like [Mercenaria mercenaria]